MAFVQQQTANAAPLVMDLGRSAGLLVTSHRDGTPRMLLQKYLAPLGVNPFFLLSLGSAGAHLRDASVWHHFGFGGSDGGGSSGGKFRSLRHSSRLMTPRSNKATASSFSFVSGEIAHSALSGHEGLRHAQRFSRGARQIGHGPHSLTMIRCMRIRTPGRIWFARLRPHSFRRNRSDKTRRQSCTWNGRNRASAHRLARRCRSTAWPAMTWPAQFHPSSKHQLVLSS